MTLQEQIDFFERKGPQAWRRRLRAQKDTDYQAIVMREARKRLVEGFELYGEQGWHMTHAELVQNELEEDADALLYRLFRMSQGWTT